MQKKEIKRGDLFYYDFGEKKGSIQSGVRPVWLFRQTAIIKTLRL